MEKVEFFVIYNSERKEFLSIYEDGEGTGYYSVVKINEIAQIGQVLFPTKELALMKLSDAISIAGFTMRMNNIKYSREFLMDAKVLPISLVFESGE